jgi:hypothetical protein
MTQSYFTVMPSAARLTRSLRDIGYDFGSAVADLVDNSIAANASEVRIEITFEGANSTVLIADDGDGMTYNGISEALRFGSRRDYDHGELGRYGLGLKTASLSQCRALTVVSRRKGSSRASVRQLDLDLIEDWDEWVVIEPGRTPTVAKARRSLAEGMNTVIVWEDLDRVLPDDMDGGWARRRLDSVIAKTIGHLSMVFHRFLDPMSSATRAIDIIVNGQKLSPWDPFAVSEPATVTLPVQTFELRSGRNGGIVRLSRYILPSKDRFSSVAAFDSHAGPLKWNRQQGLYIYRADRLVQWGGWAGVRAIDEHTKLARAALDFGTELDPLFNINVAKMRVSLPTQLKQMLERPIHELCLRADAAYRKSAPRPPAGKGASGEAPTSSTPTAQAVATTGLALRTAALQSGDFDALKRIAAILRAQAPDVARYLGLDSL